MYKKFLLKTKETYFLIFLIIAVEFFSVFSTLSLSFSINFLSINKNSESIFWVSSFVISLFLMVTLGVSQRYFQESLLKKISLKYRENIHHKIGSLDYKNFYKKDIGQYISWDTNDINMISESKYGSYIDLLRNTTNLLLLLISLFFLNYYFVLILIIFMIISFLFPKIFKRKKEQIKTAISSNNENNSVKLLDFFNGINDLFLFGYIKITKKIINKISYRFYENKVKYLFKDQNISTINSLFSLFMFYLIFLISGTLVFYKIAPIGILFVVRTYTGQLLEGANNISFNIREFKSSKVISDKLNSEIMQLEKSNKYTKITNIEKIQVNNFSIIFDKTNILNNLNITIEKNKKYLIIGESGSGKSTLVKSIFNLSDSFQGQIIFNDKYNSKDIDFSDQIFFIDKNSDIIDDSLKNNVVLWEDKVNEKMYKKSLEKSCIDFFENEDSLNDSNLSTGQKQRISIARLFYFDKPIWILDEALSNIDKKTAKTIEKNILLKQDITLINISHNLNKENINYYDFVIDLNNYKIK